MYENVWIRKPWGGECEIYRSNKVSIWYLKIEPSQETSLHMHPNKKTGLIVVGGAALVSFLNTNTKLFPSEKIMIRQNVFHKTKNCLNYPLELLEIETPIDKEDIVRLEDSYGRAGQPFDYGQSQESTLVDRINEDEIINRYGFCSLELINLNNPKQIANCKYETLIVLDGGIEHNDIQVVAHGDIIKKSNLIKLANKFNINKITAIGVRHECSENIQTSRFQQKI